MRYLLKGLLEELPNPAGAAFLMWELSTPFVYMRWFLFTLGKSDSKAYIINGLLMVGTFFVARNVFGTCESLLDTRELSFSQLPDWQSCGMHSGPHHAICHAAYLPMEVGLSQDTLGLGSECAE